MDEGRVKTESRGGQRETALFAVYDFLTYLDMSWEIPVEDIVSGLCELPYEDCPYYVKAMLIGAIGHYEEAVNAYQPRMVKWTFDRLNRVAQAILILAYCEYFHFEEKTDKAVIIDASVNLAKRYLERKDYAFINAILDKVLDGRK